MPVKTILTVTGVEQGGRDLRIAADLCSAADAHLSVLVIALATPPIMTDVGMDAYLWTQLSQPDLDRLKERAAAVTEFVAEAGVSADVSSDYPDTSRAAEVIGRRARYADLVVAGPELLASEELKSRVVEGALFSSGKPILLVPEGSSPTLRPRHVLVAWDSGLEASRALRESLDLIAASADVHVTMIDPVAGDYDHRYEPGADVAAYLARHGANVSVDRLPGQGRSIADVLARHAVDIAADMLVMGAYGHSRMRERIFGGVTRTMLDSPPLPVLMAR